MPTFAQLQLFPGAVLYLTEGNLRGTMACFVCVDGKKGLYVVTSAHVIAQDGNPHNQLLVNKNVKVNTVKDGFAIEDIGCIDKKDAKTDTGIIKLHDKYMLQLREENFYLGGSTENQKLMNAEAISPSQTAYIWGGITTTLGQGRLIRGQAKSITQERVQLTASQEPYTQPGDSGSPMFGIDQKDQSGGSAFIFAVFGNAGPNDPQWAFGEAIVSVFGAIAMLLTVNVEKVQLATWKNKDQWQP